MHHDPFAFTLLQLAFIVILGLVGRYGAGRMGQPGVLGELLIGILVAALMRAFQHTGFQNAIDGLGAFSNLGVILLLFAVGLETKVKDIVGVGRVAGTVALVGVLVPSILGWVSGRLILGPTDSIAILFVAATLCATSVGITARVLKDLGLLQTVEARIILSAAVIDDVLGLVILAVVSGLAASGSVNLVTTLKTVVMATAFVGAILFFGRRLAGAVAKAFVFLEPRQFKFFFALIVCFVLAWLASDIGLASIVGAFAAGLVLDDADFPSGPPLAESLAPLEALFAPVFFVVMGLQVNLSALMNWRLSAVALILTIVAIVGKLVCGFVADKKLDRLTIGIGMIPRGEVGLIFAATGRTSGILGAGLFSALVVMIVLTTVLTPPALRWSVGRK